MLPMKKKEKREEKSYWFAPTALGSTNTHPNFYHREGKGSWEKEKEPHIGSKKNRKELKLSKIS